MFEPVTYKLSLIKQMIYFPQFSFVWKSQQMSLVSVIFIIIFFSLRHRN